MIGEIINKTINKLESAIYGDRDYNLEIELEKTFQSENRKKIKEIGGYLGTFIVTKNGYLRRGYDNELEKVYARILGSNPVLPPFVVYENKDVHKVIKTILGLRFVEFACKPRIKTSISFAY